MSEGYFFVPLPDRVNRAKREHAILDRRAPGTFSGLIELTFVAEQPVHIGSGFKGLEGETLIRRAVEIRGGPGVPGSSLKGVLRSRYEAITKSCTQRPVDSMVKVRSESYRGVEWACFASGALSHDVFQAKCERGRMCVACALFGRMSQRSRVTVTDFVVEEGQRFELARTPKPFGPNLHHIGVGFEVREEVIKGERQRFFEVKEPKGRKFAAGYGPRLDKPEWQDIEVIPSGSLIAGELRLLNARLDELGGLLSALGSEPESVLKIGGGKAQGFGRIRLKSMVPCLKDHQLRDVQVEVSRWREAFERSEDYWKNGERRLVEIHQGDC